MSSSGSAARPLVSAERAIGGVVPMFVCAGARPVSLGYVSIMHGEGLEGMCECPCRDLCTWYAAHDLGGAQEYDDLPDASYIPAAFRMTPYFACENFNDFGKFLARERAAKQALARERSKAARKEACGAAGR